MLSPSERADFARFYGEGGLFQAAAVPGHCLRHVLGQVVVQMPPVSDLPVVRGALAGAV